ncbi:MAG: ABC transporter substrate-binding protein [Limnochordia bacterium]|jgi:branched-chain amino acid transport system substrate-binding protein|nr:ABC transporter substrate-binding protein [Bacillota bacterium]
MRRYRIVVIGLLIVLAISAVGLAADKVIKFGILAPFTGGSAPNGDATTNGALLAIEQINKEGGILGHKLELVWEDSQGAATPAVTAAQKLIYQHKVDVIIGDTQSTAVLAAEPLVAKEEVIMFPLGSAERITQLGNPWLVRVREHDELAAICVVNYIVDNLGLSKVAILHSTDQFGVGGAETITQALAAKGLKPVAIEAFNTGDRDFTGQMLNIKSAGAEALVGWAFDVELALMCRQARQLLPGVKLFGSGTAGQESFLQIAGEAAEGLVGVVTFSANLKDPAVEKLVSDYQERFGSVPQNFFVSLAYDAVNLYKMAAEKAGTVEKTAVRDALRTLRNVKGSHGLTYNVAKNGQALHELFVIQIQDNKPVVIDRVVNENVEFD